MESSQDFINLFLNETGELFYYIVIFIIYQAALLMAINQRQRSSKESSAARYVVSLTVVVVSWLALMCGALLHVVNDENVTDILPPLENAISTIIIIALGFGLLTAEKEGEIKSEYSVLGLLIGLIILGFVATTQFWETERGFYDQIQGFSWTIVALVLTLTSIFLLLTYYVNAADIPLKLLFFTLLVGGQAITIIQLLNDELTGDSAGAIRWSFVISGLLLVVIIYRMVIDRMTLAIDEVASYAETISKPFKTIAPAEAVDQTLHDFSLSVTADTPGVSSIGGRNEALELLKALGTMLDKDDTDTLPYQVVQAVAEMLKADIVVMLSYGDSTWADIVAAYDFGRKQPIAGMSINLEAQPQIFEALKTKKQQTLTVEDHSDELKDLYTRFDMSIQGTIHVQPMTRHGKVIGALILGFPYQQRQLRLNEIRLLESIGPIAARLTIISRTARIERVQAEEQAILQLVEGFEQSGEGEGADNLAVLAVRREMQDNLASAEHEINELGHHIQQLESELNKERQRIRTLLGDEEEETDEEALSVTQRIEVIAVERESLQKERQALVDALKQAQSTLIQTVGGDDDAIYQAVNQQMQSEIKELREQRDRLEKQLQELQKAPAPTTEQAEELLQTLTEDRQQLENNRQALQEHLDNTQHVLSNAGVDDVRTLLQRLGQVTKERDNYRQRATKAIQERNILLRERKKIEDAIKHENERSARIQGLEEAVLHLTQDREAIAKQRDEFQSEFNQLYRQNERIHEQNEALKQERDEALDILATANESRERLALERNESVAERDILYAELEKVKHERDTYAARVEGNRERLQEIGDEGIKPLNRIIEELTQERVQLENQLAQATRKMGTMRQELAAYRGAGLRKEGSSFHVELDVIVSLAQELRSPLSVIMGYTDTVLSESVGILGALQRKLLTRVKANVDRLAFLVEELVQIAAIDAGELKIQPNRISLTDIIDDAISNSRYKFGEKGIVIDLDFASEELWLQADEEAMRQIINNLIQNAYIVSPTEGTVHIQAAQHKHLKIEGENPIDMQGVIMVKVRDEGGGIRPEDQGRVFTRLYRAENPLIEGLGDTGVGMSITKALTEAHGGQIWLESEIGKGNTFVLVMPIEQPILQASSEAAASTES